MSCEHCAFMRSVSLPDHVVEVLTLAGGEADVFGADRATLRAAIRADLESADHRLLGSYWGQLAYVRAAIKDLIGWEAFGLVIWRANLAHWAERSSRAGLAGVEVGRRAAEGVAR